MLQVIRLESTLHSKTISISTISLVSKKLTTILDLIKFNPIFSQIFSDK